LIEKYKRERKAAKKAEATINRELTLLRHFFNKAIDFQLARSNPFRIVSKLKDGSYRTQQVRLSKEKGRERYLSKDEAQKLLNECTSKRLRVVVLAAVHTGFRSSELKSLHWTNIDLENKSATVENRYAKKGETRTVPLSDDLVKALTELNEEENPKPEDLVFPSPRNRKKRWDWREAFNGAVERAGIADFTFHDLRHCFGSHLGMAGTNQKPWN